MIDVHLHLLPGVDDGCPDLDAALELARDCYAAGIPVVVATPHVDDWTRGVLPDAAAVKTLTVRLQDELEQAGIPLRVLTGGEAFLSPALPRQIRDGLVPTIAGTTWLLVETSIEQKPLFLEQVFFELLTDGITPLLAHPERYGWLHRNPNLLDELVRMGVRTQITASSLTARRGNPQRTLAEDFVRRGLAQVIATDRHGPGDRGALHAAHLAAGALIGERRARALVEEHPRMIVEGKPIAATIEDAGPGRRWLHRLFGR